MIGAIAGDIVGSRFEGYPAPPPDYDLFAKNCRFTDDTVCSVAIASALHGGSDFTTSLRHFVLLHPGRGYGRHFQRWALNKLAPAYGSYSNGAPMRVAAIGWWASTEAEILELAAAQAEVSHNHPDAIRASQAVAWTIFALRHDQPRTEIVARLSEKFGVEPQTPEPNIFDISAIGTVKAALSLALSSSSWEDAVRSAIALGGDTDTLACIAGAVAEAMHEVPEQYALQARSYLTPILREKLSLFEAALTGRTLEPLEATQ